MSVAFEMPFPALEHDSLARQNRPGSRLLNAPFFAGLTEEQCSMVTAAARRMTFLRNDLLFLQGQSMQSFSLIESGTVKLSRSSPCGSEVVLWFRGPGEAVGMAPPLHDARHTATARVVETCTTLTWETEVLGQLCHDFPQINRNIHAMTHARLVELEERYCELAIESVDRRLACTLRRLMIAIGKDDSHGVHIGISQVDLGKMTGIAKFTISRVISNWSNHGIVIPRREALIVREPAVLEALCLREVAALR